MNRRLLFLLGLTLCIPGCQKGNAPVNQGPATPSEISSSQQVVKAYAHFIPKSATPANVELAVSPGFHINANPATFSYLIATEVQPGKVEGVSVARVEYPAGVSRKFVFAEQPLSVYEGNVTIPLPLTIAADAKGQKLLPLKIRVQACDEEKCFPPATLDAAVAIDIDALRR